MELSLEQIWRLRGPLSKLGVVPMSVTAGYRIGKLLDAVQSEFNIIEEHRRKLAKQACVDAGEPDASSVPAAATEKYLEEFIEFLKADKVEIPVRSINAESLNGDITPLDLMVLIDCGIVVGLEE